MEQEVYNNQIIQLHIAEYNTLTTRNTYLITCQFSLLPVAILFLTIAVQVWGSISDKAFLIWFSCLCLQVIGLIWYYCGFECYRNISYIENKLRPLIVEEIGEKQFWKYEEYLSEKRPKNFATWFEYVIPVIAVIIISSIGFIRYKQIIIIEKWGTIDV